MGGQGPAASLYSRIKTFHGSFFIGSLGDALIEIAAGLAVLMIAPGPSWLAVCSVAGK
ncbi:hypothetical protein Y017_06870 [Alcanivorax sp. 97CO-5]|nr:hypothetical protein Y017_06870 [Alcanivorax sp. 97CO-5]